VQQARRLELELELSELDMQTLMQAREQASMHSGMATPLPSPTGWVQPSFGLINRAGECRAQQGTARARALFDPARRARPWKSKCAILPSAPAESTPGAEAVSVAVGASSPAANM